VGDTLNFWVLKHNPLFDTIKAVCKAVGEHCYVFVETAMWDEGFVDETDVQQLLLRFEEQTFADTTRGIFEMMLENFGPVPDALDNDPRVYILVFDLGSYGDGYFMFFDQFTQEQVNEELDNSYKSNEKEVLYLNAKNDLSSGLMLSVAAHELEHMIHWNTDPDEESWIDEGCAELAMYHFGYPDPIVLFNMFPDNDLTMWNSGFADYVQTYLFIMYLYEHYGGTSIIKTLLNEEANSIEGVNNTLAAAGYSDADFRKIFSDWVIANYLDYRDLDSGIYNYENIHLPKFEASRGFSKYPIEQSEGTVSPWAADYIWMNNGVPQEFRFDGVDDGEFHVSIIKIDYSSNLIVEYIILDDKQNGSVELPDFGRVWDQIIVVVSNQASFSPTQYSYSSSLVTDIDNEEILPAEFSLDQNYPNPFNPTTTINYSVPKFNSPPPGSAGGGLRDPTSRGDFAKVRLVIYDVLGRKVKTLMNDIQFPGEYSVVFDASSLPSGTYYYQLSSGNFSQIRKMILIK
jgi:hypothetical protein